MKIFITVHIVLFGGLVGLLYWAHLPTDGQTSYMINGAGAQGAGASKIRLITYNIAYGRGLEDDIVVGRKGEDVIRKNLNGIGRLLKDNGADIAFLQEVDLAFKRTHFIDEARYLAEDAGAMSDHLPVYVELELP